MTNGNMKHHLLKLVVERKESAREHKSEIMNTMFSTWLSLSISTWMSDESTLQC
jgi:hypothetical protein